MIKAVAALLCLAVPASASAACFTRAEMRGVAAVVANPLMSGLAARCATFPAVAPVLTAARPSLATRFRAEASAAGPVIAPKVAQLMGQPNADPEKIMATAGPFLDLMLSQQLAKIDAKTCRIVDDFAAVLLPLGDAQLVDLTATVLIAIARDRPNRDFSLCEAK